MARLGINYNDVAQAADSISASGERATVDRIREYLGTGSKSTIAPMLKRWREQQDDASALPEHLQTVVAQIYETLKNEAFDQAEAEKLRLERALDDLTKAKTLAEQQATSALEQVDQLDTALHAEKIRTESAENSSTALLQQNMELSARNQQLENHLADTKEQLLEQKQINRRQSDSAEHYQQQIAEERSLERQQFEQQLGYKQDELISLRQEHQKTLQSSQNLQESHNELRLSKQSLQHDHDDLEQLNQALAKQLNVESDAVKAMKQTLDQSLSDFNTLKLQQEKDSHQDQLTQNALIAELESARSRTVLLNDELKQSKTELHAQNLAFAKLEARLAVYQEFSDKNTDTEL